MSVYRPSMTYFQEWLARMNDDLEVNIHYQGNHASPPYFTHGTYRDYEHVLQISGHSIMMYADGTPRIPENAVEIAFQNASPSSAASGAVCIGYETSNGIHVSCDPRYMRFVSWNEDRSRWDHVDVEEGAPTAVGIFLEAIGVEAFARNWTPPTLEDVMRRTWLRKREQQISTAHRRVASATAALENYEAGLEGARNELAESRAALSEWGHMTLEKFMESINMYRDQLAGIGNDLIVLDGKISVELASFQVQGVTLGPYTISYDIATSRVRVYGERANRSRNGHIHPHIGSDGAICWGAHGGIYNASLGNPFEALFLTAGFLKTGYYATGAYCRLESWSIQDTYFCAHCDRRHNNNSPCPAECGECGDRVDWDNHAHCGRHFLCFNRGETECVQCVAERKQREDEAAKKLAEAAGEEDAIKKKKVAKKKATKKKTTKKKATKKTSKRQSRRAVTVLEAAE